MTQLSHPHILSAIRTLDIESAGITALRQQLDSSFIAAVDLFCNTKGRVIVMGMGKSGHVGRKIAATLSSTGTPALFVHPAEASHGDLGMITKNDLLLAISNSGEADEIVAIIPHVRRMGIPIVAITGQPDSTLAKQSHLIISSKVDMEACPHNLAPTASTTAQLAMGDAIAIACLESKGFQPSDFAASHPGGALGRKLLTRVSDIMRTGTQLPLIHEKTTFLEMMELMSQSKLGLAIMTDEKNVPVGIFTDGDLRRLIAAEISILTCSVSSVMRLSPKTIHQSALAVDAAGLMELHNITSLLVVDDAQSLVGVINTNDLLRSKVI